MSRVTMYQANFTVGEIDPLVVGRTDIQQYASGLQKAQNVVILPQGGFERRPGLRLMAELPYDLQDVYVNDAPVPDLARTNLDSLRLIPFEFSTTESYMMVLYKLRASVQANNNRLKAQFFANGQLAFPPANEFASPNELIIEPGANIDLSKLSFTQNADTLILCNEEANPFQIIRNASGNFETSQISLTSPKHAFRKHNFNRPGTITPDANDGTLTITASSDIFNEGHSGQFGGGSVTANVPNNSTTLASTASSVDDVYNGQFITIISGSSTRNGVRGVIVDYIGSSRTAQVERILADGSRDPNNKFSNAQNDSYTISSQVDQYINVKNGFGRARIISVDSPTTCKVVTEFPFFEANQAIASGDYEIEAGYEDVWSDNRGYPRTATFHEGRLFFGGSKSMPNTLFGSKVGDFFNFKTAEALDDDAIMVTMATDTVNAITALRSGRDLQIFTENAEFFVPQADSAPITPSNIIIKSPTSRGSKDGIKPVSAEGGTIFLQRGGKAIREFLFSDNELSYQANNISLLASHLIKQPRDMALRKATSTDDGDLLMMPNTTDGSMAVFSILRSQNVVAPSEFVTDGKFLNVGVDLSDVYVITERELPLGHSKITFQQANNTSDQEVGTTVILKTNDGTTYTLQSEAHSSSDPSSPSGNTYFYRIEEDLNNIGGPSGIVNPAGTAHNFKNAVNSITGSPFTARSDPLGSIGMGSGMVTIERNNAGLNNLTVTTNSPFAIQITNSFEARKKVYVELFDDQRTTDSNIQYFSNVVPLASPDQTLPTTTSLSNLDHLKGKTVNVVRDDIVESNKTVSNTGTITIASVPTSFVEVGLPYSVEVKTLPAEPRLPSGAVSSRKKRIVEVTPVVDRTQNLAVNGFEVPFEDLPVDLNVAREIFTGRKKVSALLGYSETEQITFTMTQPLFATVLSVEYKLSTGS